MVKKVKDKVKIKVVDLLKSHPDGLTIAEIMKHTGLARHTVLARLHNLEGAGDVGVRQINMAKLHKWEKKDEPISEVDEKKKVEVPSIE